MKNKKMHNLIFKYIAIVLNMYIFFSAFIFTIIGFFNGVLFDGNVYYKFELFKFFTFDSNLFLAGVSLFSAIYQIKHFKDYIKLPKLLSVLKLSANTCTMLTIIICTLILGPDLGYANLFTNEQFFLHFVNPIVGVIIFAIFEGNHELKYKHILLSLLAPLIYVIFYIFMVSIFRVWPDYYGFIEPFNLRSFLICLISPITLSALIVILNDLVNKVRKINAKKDYGLDAITIYNTRIFKGIFIIMPLIAVLASITYTISWIVGLFPDVSGEALLVFDFSCVLYTYLGLHFLTRQFDRNGVLKSKAILKGKIAVAVVLLLQFNACTYIFPLQGFWGFAFFFIAIPCVFIDYKLVDIVCVEILGSVFLSWIIKGDVLLPQHDANFAANMQIRLESLILGCIAFHIVTYLGGKYLIEALERVSEYDPLTQLRNRRRMDKYIQDLIDKDKNFCVAMIDIDDFKKVNDTYGHDKGDEVLKSLSSIVLSNIYETDTAFRYGGEEIIIIFNTTLKNTINSASRICRRLATKSFESDANKFNITISVGIYERNGEFNIEDLINEADKRLYKAKHDGKNRICS